MPMFGDRVWRSIAAAALLFAAAATAQEEGDAPRRPPENTCVGGHFDDFDFWVGDWQVMNAATGQPVGRNHIEKRDGGCLLIEHWQGDRGGTGTSLNYYNPNTETWRQLWVAPPGYVIDISGRLNGAGAMVLEGTIEPYGGGQSRFRGTWTPREDGSVRQFFEQYDAQEDAWKPWFDGIYVVRAKSGTVALD